MEKHIEYNGNKYTLSNQYYRRVKHILLHRQVWEDHNGPIPEGFHIHHKDGNKLNNDISNLDCLSASDHHKRTWVDNYDSMREATTKNLKPYKRLKKHRQRMSKWSKDLWSNKEKTTYICPECGLISYTLQPKLKLRCRKCQKDKHYRESQEKRNCLICLNQFKVYKHSKTYTCSPKCKGRAISLKRK